MNNIDAENIRRIIEWRKNKPFFKEGGIFTSEELDDVSTEELENWLKGSEKDQKPKFKKMVDEFFEKYGKDGDNIILLTCAYVPDRETYDAGLPWKYINYDGFNHDYNKLYYPVKVDEDNKECMKEWKAILEMSKSVGITDAEKYWTDVEDNEALNELWYGVIGIMKDYKAVSFVIRDDGMLCDEDDIDSYYNSVIVDLAK